MHAGGKRATEGAPSQEDSAGADGHRGPGLAGPPATCGSACSSRHPGIARSIRKNECCSGRPSRNSPPLCSPATSISQPSPWKNCRSHRILRQNNRRKPTQNPLVWFCPCDGAPACYLGKSLSFVRKASGFLVTHRESLQPHALHSAQTTPSERRCDSSCSDLLAAAAA